MKHDIKNLNSMNNFFKCILENDSCSTTEAINFTENYLRYVMEEENLNRNQMDISIHFNKKYDSPDFTGYCEPSLFYEDKFDVYLKSNFIQMRQSKDINNIIALIVVAGHEFAHIVQFYKNPIAMQDFYKQTYGFEKKISEAEKSNMEKPLLKKLIKKMQGHYNETLLLATTEIEADEKSVKYFTTLIENLISIEQNKDEINEKYLGFISTLLDAVEYSQIERRKEYQQAHHHDKQMQKILTKEFKIKKSDLRIP